MSSEAWDGSDEALYGQQAVLSALTQSARPESCHHT